MSRLLIDKNLYFFDKDFCCSHSFEDILKLLVNNLGFFGHHDFFMDEIFKDALHEVLIKLKYLLSHVNNAYARTENGEIYFSPYQSCQYAIFLYLLANTLYKIDAHRYHFLSDKLYILNKMLNSVELYYQIELPEIFYLEHPLGSVMGRAKFANFFYFLQGCTVGHNKGCYPSLDHHCVMYANSSIFGNCHIGHHVILAANTTIIDEDIPPWSLVFGSSPQLCIKRINEEYFTSLLLPFID